MAQGWISLHRKVLENPLVKPKGKYTDFEAWVYLLLRASHDNAKVRIGVNLIWCEPGDIITSQVKLCKQFKWGNTKLRNFLKLLESDSMIEVRTHSNMTQITIINYRDLQKKHTPNKVKTNSKQITSKDQSQTYNNVNNENNVNKRKTKFITDVVGQCKNQNQDLVKEFTDYWTELNHSKTKMRFELQKTFEVTRRFGTWLKNSKDWSKRYFFKFFF